MSIDTLLLILVGLCALAIVYGVGRLVVLYRASKRREAERQRMMQERLEQMRREAHERVRKVNSQPITKSTQVATPKKVEVPPRGKETSASYSPSYAPSPTQSVRDSSSSDDGFLTGMLTGYALNTIMSGSGRSSESTEERSVGVLSRESSWGFDDSDSRKSASDTFSSSSSDSWSSSDSGPSSDW